MTHIVFKDNEVVFSGDSLAIFDDDTLVVTTNLEEYDPSYDYSVVDGEAVKGEPREIPHPPEE
tara:strand:+ start:1866 stop:2054 length:189 start_codon:yes stop_codon:yes gene_type:complete